MTAAQTAPAPEKKNLILVTHPERQDWRDFEAIGNRIVRMASDVAVYIVSPQDTAETIEDWGRRSLIVSFGDRLGRFEPLRGRFFKNSWIPKHKECSLFAAAGVRIPATSMFRVGQRFDCSKHAPLVVAKPTKAGSMSHGNNVVLMRRERVEQVVPSRFAPELTSDEAPILIQDFIDTGVRPGHFRVLALFGEPLFCFRATSTIDRPRLDAGDAELESGLVASNSAARIVELVSDAEVIEFARKASRAMWWIPLQGLDIVREAHTDALHVLEANPGGNTWSFSSQMGENLRVLVGGSEAFENQFGAWDIAAKALIKATRSWAE